MNRCRMGFRCYQLKWFDWMKLVSFTGPLQQ